MKTLIAILMGLFITLALVRAEESVDMKLEAGGVAPEFSLVDQKGVTRKLSDYKDHWLVLYFYPKDDTPGCTTEACQFRDDYFEIKKLGAEVMGVSIDNRDSHEAFAKKYSLPFPLLADAEGSVAKQYGALMGFGPVKFAKRHTFIIDPQGKLAKIYRDVTPKTHSRQVIADLKSLLAEQKK